MSPRSDDSAVATDTAILKAAEKIQGPSRTALQGFLQMLAVSDAKSALRCADNAAGILLQLNQSQQHLLLNQALALADMPETAAEFFCNCVELVRNLDEGDLCSWVKQGKTLALENPNAAAAFFRQESLASISALRKLRQSVHIGEVSRILQLYCTAIAGKPIGVKPTAEAPQELAREGHHLPLTDGKAVYLPGQLDNRPSHEENFTEYKVLAAHQAGYIEFGTFDLDLDVLLDHPVFGLLARRDRDTEAGPIASHYELFFRLFHDRRLARDVFFAIEDGRVDFRLRRKYPGLAPELGKVAMDALHGRPPPSSLPLQEALVESLIRLSISGRIEEALPEKALSIYRYICAMFSRVLVRSATVTDSAVAAARIYSVLSALPNILMNSPLLDLAVGGVRDMVAGGPRDSARPEAGSLEPGISDSTMSESEVRHYRPAQPVPYRGQTRPELVQLEMAIEMLRDAVSESEETGVPMTRELLEELLRRGVKIKISQMTAKELAEASSLFITDLDGVVQEKLEKLSPEERKKLAKLLQKASVVRSETPELEPTFLYDEWDYLIGDYRPKWCRLREVSLEGGSSQIVARIRKEHSALISAVRRHFQRIRPEMLRRVKRLRSGEEIGLDDAIEAVIDRRAGLTPSERIYQKRERRTRDVATVFLLDLSASTDEWVLNAPVLREELPLSRSRATIYNIFAHDTAKKSSEGFSPPEGSKRVIDVEREALVIMAEALESLGDEYAIYGFSGYGRDNIEFFPIKDFSERYSEQIRCRIGAIKPRKSTRMGPAIRHALEKLAATGCRLKVLILLSDGYPQDFDYGPDRSSRDYGLHDTMMALQEARKKNVHTFCVTVDQAGNDYLREMCGGENYLVVERPGSLPRILPRVYRGLTV